MSGGVNHAVMLSLAHWHHLEGDLAVTVEGRVGPLPVGEGF